MTGWAIFAALVCLVALWSIRSYEFVQRRFGYHQMTCKVTYGVAPFSWTKTYVKPWCSVDWYHSNGDGVFLPTTMLTLYAAEKNARWSGKMRYELSDGSLGTGDESVAETMEEHMAIEARMKLKDDIWKISPPDENVNR